VRYIDIEAARWLASKGVAQGEQEVRPSGKQTANHVAQAEDSEESSRTSATSSK
jgi:hypothetical protein